MRRGALALTVLLAACAQPSGTSPVASAPSEAATPVATPVASPSPTPTPSPPPIGDVLPTHLGDLELHTFEVGRDILGRLAAELGLQPTDLEVTYASEHGERFLQMYAIRAPGADGESLRDALVRAAYLPSSAEVEVSEDTLAGHPVTVVHSDAEAQFIGDFYAVDLGHTLVVAQAFDRAVAEEALQALR